MCQAILDMKKEAENKGINEGLTKVALNLVKLGKMSLEEISDVTGLPLEGIKNLSLKKIILFLLYKRLMLVIIISTFFIVYFIKLKERLYEFNTKNDIV